MNENTLYLVLLIVVPIIGWYLLKEEKKDREAKKANPQPLIEVPTNVALKYCIHCKKEISKTARTCPGCGGVNPLVGDNMMLLIRIVAIGFSAYVLFKLYHI